MNAPTCSVIIVTYNSQQVIDKAMQCLYQQTVPPDEIILVDSGSSDKTYLQPYASFKGNRVLFAGEGIGFCRGNNEGFKHLSPKTDYLFLVNPDAFIAPDFIEKALHFMEHPDNSACAVLTGMVYGYDLQKDCPSGYYDTTGIFQRWYGRWFDRGQGEVCQEGAYATQEELPAVCGALMFCRKKAIDTVLIGEHEFFDNRFFMYKEDIDLSLRLKKKGWKLIYHPDLKAYHCRGWNPDRSKMARRMRLLSARNELWIHLKAKMPLKAAYSSLKYLSVMLLNK